MTNTNVFQLSQPGAFADPLTDCATAHERCWRRRSRSRLQHCSARMKEGGVWSRALVNPQGSFFQRSRRLDKRRKSDQS